MKQRSSTKTGMLSSIWVLIFSLIPIILIICLIEFDETFDLISFVVLILSLTVLSITLNITGIVLGFNQVVDNKGQSVIAILGNLIALVWALWMTIGYFVESLSTWTFNGN